MLFAYTHRWNSSAEPACCAAYIAAHPPLIVSHSSFAGLESDLYVRKIDGYLPTAEVAFVDEIFKVCAGGVIGQVSLYCLWYAVHGTACFFTCAW